MWQHLYFSQEALVGSLWSPLCSETALWLTLRASFSQIRKQNIQGTHSSSPHPLRISRQDSWSWGSLRRSCPIPALSRLTGVRSFLCLDLPTWPWPRRRVYQWFTKEKIIRIYFGLVLFFFLAVLYVCLFLAIWLGQEERAGRENFLVWIFLNNENLAVELYERLTGKKPYQLAICCTVSDAGWCLTKLQPK